MAAIRTTTSNFGKYTAALVEQLNASMSKGTKITVGKKNYVIEDTKQNKESIKEYVKLSSDDSNKKKAFAILLTTKNDRPIAIGSIDKPKVQGSIGNKGDMAEGMLGAAMAARFLNKTKKITEDDVLKMLNQLKGSKTKKTLTKKSENKNKKVQDELTFFLSLAEKNMTSLMEKDTQTVMKDIAKAAAAFANSKTVADWADLLYNNNVSNHIEVIADGLSGQTTTKVDVYVKIDGKKVNINVSLKAGDVKTFGQVGGAGFEKQIELWKSIINIDVKKHESKFNGYLKKGDQVGALDYIYSQVAKEANQKLKTAQKKNILLALGEGIKYHATKNEENVILVQLNKKAATIYAFESIQNVLKNLRLEAKLEYDSKGKPKIQFVDERNDVLLTIRMKIENKPNGVYVKNYIEKGPLLSELISETVR